MPSLTSLSVMDIKQLLAASIEGETSIQFHVDPAMKDRADSASVLPKKIIISPSHVFNVAVKEQEFTPHQSILIAEMKSHHTFSDMLRVFKRYLDAAESGHKKGYISMDGKIVARTRTHFTAELQMGLRFLQNLAHLQGWETQPIGQQASDSEMIRPIIERMHADLTALQTKIAFLPPASVDARKIGNALAAMQQGLGKIQHADQPITVKTMLGYLERHLQTYRASQAALKN